LSENTFSAAFHVSIMELTFQVGDSESAKSKLMNAKAGKTQSLSVKYAFWSELNLEVEFKVF